MNTNKTKEWKNVQETLQTSMKQEIWAMREMLANMHQEEISLLAGDRTTRKMVMIERSNLLSLLTKLRDIRLEATKQMEELNSSLQKDVNEDNCEFLSMRDQLTALVEKMNEQKIRNEHLELQTSQTTIITPWQKAPPKSKIVTLVVEDRETLDDEQA